MAERPRRIVLPGGSGYLGRALCARLVAGGDEVVVLTRGRAGMRDGVRFVAWDGETVGPWAEELEGAHAVVHLAGRRVDVRPTRRNIDELITSRVRPVTAVGEALSRCSDPPSTWVQLGTLAIYGEGGDQLLDETVVPSGLGPRQMVTVALAWEHAVHHATRDLDRLVLLRAGVAIGADDPATTQLSRLARVGLGGTIGSGRQWLSWIALPDLLRIIELALDDAEVAGIYHACAPAPITNAELMAAIRTQVGRRAGLPSPAALTRVGALLLGADPALALTGRRGVPARLLDHGFAFEHERFDTALAAARGDARGRARRQLAGRRLRRHR